MKAILICPGYRPGVAQLIEDVPLAAVPLLGESLVVYWLVHLAALGARDVTVVASDRADAIRGIVGTGSRWGLRVTVLPESHELTVATARSRHGGGEGWLAAPHDVILADCLPGLPAHRLGENYAEWYAAVQAWGDRAVTPDRTGVREIAPGVRVGWQSVIPPDAVLRAPCWIGEKVTVGPGAIIGPHAVVEDRAMVGAGAEIVRSIVGPDTMVGDQTEVADSLALGDTLVNWQDGSCLHVPDEYLLCSLRRPRTDVTEWFRRVAQVLTGAQGPMLPADHSPVANPPL
jgi:NDP-sugar pyrophosphorylase family protein